MPSKNPEINRKNQRAWKQKNKDKINARRRQLYAENAEKHRQRLSEYRKSNKEKVNEYNAAWLRGYRSKVRKELIESYGGKCVCCGEDEPMFLELDHINNDGAAQRKSHQNQFQEWLALRALGWPKENHQLLCANCNRGKLRNGGICPHKQPPKTDPY